ncbi:hypothetical protein MMC21_003418 [Puttea exsequens]|nr:hypothetical protein [Puttea exsequens]
MTLNSASVPWRIRASHVSNVISQSRSYSAPVEGAIPAGKAKYVPKAGNYPKGFSVSGTYVGVKASNKRFPDLALLTSETPASAAAVFTQNIFQAAPVTLSKDALQKTSGEGIRSVIINAGCANAVTGQGGLEDAKSMAATVNQSQPNPTPNGTLVMSTGVIGQRLPIQKILDSIPKAISNQSNTHDAWLTTARSICTTDTFPKLLSRSFTLPSSPSTTYAIAGMTKGAGMIHPNMATLLGVLCTDAPIPARTLRPLLTHAVERSFNAISVDGSTSTNDTLAILANGAAGGKVIDSPTSEDGQAMQQVLTEFTQELSQLVVRDGEGATKFVRVRIINSPSFTDTKKIASSVARDPLVKTALYGKDANWGRILCAIGYTPDLAPGTVVPERTSVSFVPVDGSEKLKLVVNGEPETVDEKRAAQILRDEDLEILVDLGGGADGKGTKEASYWFCDFSHEYVTINGDYRT